MNPLTFPTSAPPSQPASPAVSQRGGRPWLTARSLRLLSTRGIKGRARHRRLAGCAAAGEGMQERERLAQLLHDQLGGLLVQLRLAYGAWRLAAPPTGPDDPGAVFDALLAELSCTVRHLTSALAPPDWHDELLPALESVAAELALRSRLQVRLNGDALRATDTLSAPGPLRAVACRVVRELGLNVLKHARASSLDIQVAVVAGQLSIRVKDDGIGLPAEAAARPADGLGLRSARAQLRALGGSLVLQSSPGQGTCAMLTLPIIPTQASHPACQAPSSAGD
jgi:signal transduction histidine kinase